MGCGDCLDARHGKRKVKPAGRNFGQEAPGPTGPEG